MVEIAAALKVAGEVFGHAMSVISKRGQKKKDIFDKAFEPMHSVMASVVADCYEAFDVAERYLTEDETFDAKKWKRDIKARRLRLLDLRERARALADTLPRRQKDADVERFVGSVIAFLESSRVSWGGGTGLSKLAYLVELFEELELRRIEPSELLSIISSVRSQMTAANLEMTRAYGELRNRYFLGET